MTMDPQPSPTKLVDLLQRVRDGRKAYVDLTKSMKPSPVQLSVLQSNCLDGLQSSIARHGEKGLADKLSWLLARNAPSVIDWFEQLYAVILKQALDPLLGHRWRVQGEDPLLTQFQEIQAGEKARESLAEELQAGLYRQADKLKNLLPRHLSKSDLVNSVLLRLLDWLVQKFDGQTDGQLWSAALEALRNQAFEYRRRPDLQRGARPIFADDALDKGPTPSGVFAEAELTPQADWAQRRAYLKIDTIPEADRLLFLLYFLEKRTYAHLAELLGGEETEDSIGRRVRAVAEELRTRLGPDQKPISLSEKTGIAVGGALTDTR